MRRLLLIAVLCAVAVSVAAVVNAGGKTQLTTTLRFDERSTLFKVIDIATEIVADAIDSDGDSG